MLIALLVLISIELILLWIRSEYMFVLFYVLANFLIVFLISDLWILTWSDVPAYALSTVVALGVQSAAGVAIVTLFKWLKTRKTGHDKQLDKEMERIRAEIAAREAPQ